MEIRFTEEAVREVARVAALVNKTVENIGARRLHTVLERIVEVRSPRSFQEYRLPRFVATLVQEFLPGSIVS